jgi:hypothetical protein
LTGKAKAAVSYRWPDRFRLTLAGQMAEMAIFDHAGIHD